MIREAIRETERLTAQATPAECIAYGLALALEAGDDVKVAYWQRMERKLEGGARGRRIQNRLGL